MLAVLERQVMRNIVRYRTEASSGGFSRNARSRTRPWSTCFGEFALHASRRPRIAQALASMRANLRAEIVELLRPTGGTLARRAPTWRRRRSSRSQTASRSSG